MEFYIYAIIALIIGIFLIKKFIGCISRIVITVILLAVLAAIYYYYFMQ